MKKSTLSILLIIGIILVINFLSNEFFFRIDATKDKTYTLSESTKNILKNIEEPVTVSGYLTEDLPPQLANILGDFKNLLKEYNRRSGGMVNFEFFDPNTDPQLEQQAMQSGVQPTLIRVRENDQFTQKKAYMGAIVKAGNQQDVIPMIQDQMEYALTTAIKKVSVADKPSIGMISGFGCADVEQLGQVYQALSVLYSIEPIQFTTAEEIPIRFKTVMMVAPQDSIPAPIFGLLDNYLANGGNLCIAFDAVKGDFQSVQGTVLNNGVNNWLASKGLLVEPVFVVDKSCGSISVQQRQGFFTMNTPVEFPYFPRVSKFPDHPITKGLDGIIFPFASPITYNGSGTFSPLVQTSNRSGTQTPPFGFNIQKQWGGADFPLGSQTIGGVLEDDFGGTGVTSKLVVFSDGEFAGAGQGKSNADNFSLLVNSVDWLSDDTGLIDLRTKGVVSRDIDPSLEDSDKSFYKWLNFLLPIFLVLLIAFIRHQRNRNIRMKRMQERFVS